MTDTETPNTTILGDTPEVVGTGELKASGSVTTEETSVDVDTMLASEAELAQKQAVGAAAPGIAQEVVEILSPSDKTVAAEPPKERRARGPQKGVSTTDAKIEEDDIVLGFKSICNFVKALNEVFGDRSAGLQLYAHLLEKTGLIHEEPIRKHLQIFKTWLKSNESMVVTKNYRNAKELEIDIQPIKYSDKVYLDMKFLLESADDEQLEVIHTHLLTIAAVLDPSSEARRILRQRKAKQNAASGKRDDDVLTNIFKKIGDNINLDSGNPLEMVSSVLNSGVVSDVMNVVNEGFGPDGNIDFVKMLGSLQTVVQNFSQDSSTAPSS